MLSGGNDGKPVDFPLENAKPGPSDHNPEVRTSETARCLRHAGCTAPFGNAAQSFSSQQILHDRAGSRHQTLELLPDHELRNDCLHTAARQSGKTRRRFRDIIRKLVQHDPDLIAMPCLDGSRDVKHVAGLDAGPPVPDLLGELKSGPDPARIAPLRTSGLSWHALTLRGGPPGRAAAPGGIRMQTQLWMQDVVMLLLTDNCDSFTFGLVRFLDEPGAECRVRRNDSLPVEEALAQQPSGIILARGHATPTRRASARASCRPRPRPAFPCLGPALAVRRSGRRSAEGSCVPATSFTAGPTPFTTRARAPSAACLRPFGQRAAIRRSSAGPAFPAASIRPQPRRTAPSRAFATGVSRSRACSSIPSPSVPGTGAR